jgi:hypothetical protein
MKILEKDEDCQLLASSAGGIITGNSKRFIPSLLACFQGENPRDWG